MTEAPPQSAIFSFRRNRAPTLGTAPQVTGRVTVKGAKRRWYLTVLTTDTVRIYTTTTLGAARSQPPFEAAELERGRPQT